jgi:ribonuclease-3
VFLDGGYQAAVAVVEQLWGDRLRTSASPVRDPKTALQEWAQARGLPTPSYREIARTGPHHDPQFRVAVQLPELMPAEGLGRSKRAAEQAAAAALLSREGVEAP